MNILPTNSSYSSLLDDEIPPPPPPRVLSPAPIRPPTPPSPTINGNPPLRPINAVQRSISPPPPPPSEEDFLSLPDKALFEELSESRNNVQGSTISNLGIQSEEMLAQNLTDVLQSEIEKLQKILKVVQEDTSLGLLIRANAHTKTSSLLHPDTVKKLSDPFGFLLSESAQNRNTAERKSQRRNSFAMINRPPLKLSESSEEKSDSSLHAERTVRRASIDLSHLPQTKFKESSLWPFYSKCPPPEPEDASEEALQLYRSRWTGYLCNDSKQRIKTLPSILQADLPFARKTLLNHPTWIQYFHPSIRNNQEIMLEICGRESGETIKELLLHIKDRHIKAEVKKIPQYIAYKEESAPMKTLARRFSGIFTSSQTSPDSTLNDSQEVTNRARGRSREKRDYISLNDEENTTAFKHASPVRFRSPSLPPAPEDERRRSAARARSPNDLRVPLPNPPLPLRKLSDSAKKLSTPTNHRAISPLAERVLSPLRIPQLARKQQRQASQERRAQDVFGQTNGEKRMSATSPAARRPMSGLKPRMNPSLFSTFSTNQSNLPILSTKTSLLEGQENVSDAPPPARGRRLSMPTHK